MKLLGFLILVNLMLFSMVSQAGPVCKEIIANDHKSDTGLVFPGFVNQYSLETGLQQLVDFSLDLQKKALSHNAYQEEAKKFEDRSFEVNEVLGGLSMRIGREGSLRQAMLFNQSLVRIATSLPRQAGLDPLKRLIGLNPKRPVGYITADRAIELLLTESNLQNPEVDIDAVQFYPLVARAIGESIFTNPDHSFYVENAYNFDNALKVKALIYAMSVVPQDERSKAIYLRKAATEIRNIAQLEFFKVIVDRGLKIRHRSLGLLVDLMHDVQFGTDAEPAIAAAERNNYFRN